jgi:hypothetical protein
MPGSASADWTLYLAGDMGTSSATVDASGRNNALGLSMDGSYSDASPLISGAFGIAIPIDEITPWELPYDVRLPHWPFRLEMEVTGLRSFEGLADGFSAVTPMFGSTDSWSIMFDLWQDVPMRGLNGPIARAFGRTPRWVVKTLDNMTFFAGGGVGVANVGYRFTDGFHLVEGDSYNFSWQVGTGFGYSLTNAVTMSLGYRYFDYGSIETDLIDTALAIRGPFSISQGSHEFRFGLRFNVWGFRSPWL